MKKNHKHLVFDAANTLIHKPSLWSAWDNVLINFGYHVDLQQLKIRHKFLSEHIFFPDRTTEDFYREFNSEVLLALNIPPTADLLDKLFKACSYLPWEIYPDTEVLLRTSYECSVISNFHSGLRKILASLLPNMKFTNILISEELGSAKPSTLFYTTAFKEIGGEPQYLHYVGDSLKLDVLPAKELGVNTYLIDRLNMYPSNKEVHVVNSLVQFIDHCEK